MSPTRAGPTRPALRYHGGKWRIAPWINPRAAARLLPLFAAAA